jgi:hypothetical protein
VKLVEIRGGAPLLNDIPGQLEQLAKFMRDSKAPPRVVLVLMRDEVGRLDMSGYGEVCTEDERAGLLLRAAQHCSAIADLDADEAAEPEPAA